MREATIPNNKEGNYAAAPGAAAGPGGLHPGQPGEVGGVMPGGGREQAENGCLLISHFSAFVFQLFNSSFC